MGRGAWRWEVGGGDGSVGVLESGRMQLTDGFSNQMARSSVPRWRVGRTGGMAARIGDGFKPSLKWVADGAAPSNSVAPARHMKSHYIVTANCEGCEGWGGYGARRIENGK